MKMPSRLLQISRPPFPSPRKDVRSDINCEWSMSGSPISYVTRNIFLPLTGPTFAIFLQTSDSFREPSNEKSAQKRHRTEMKMPSRFLQISRPPFPWTSREHLRRIREGLVANICNSFKHNMFLLEVDRITS